MHLAASVCKVDPESGAESLRIRTVEGDRLANERLEGGLVNFFSFADVDRAAYVSLETRVEETGGSFRDAPFAKVSFTTLL